MTSLPCPVCGAPTRWLDPIGGVDGPAVVECEAGHQSQPDGGEGRTFAAGGPVSVSVPLVGSGEAWFGVPAPSVPLAPGRYRAVYDDDHVTLERLADEPAAATPGMVAKLHRP